MTRDQIIAANPLARYLMNRGYYLRQSDKNFVTNACPVAEHKKYHRPVTIDTDKNLWHCNDCERGGTVIDWVMIEKNVSVADAMRILGGERNSSEMPSNKSSNRPVRRLIVETYDYKNEAGELLSQCVRYLPKHFSQRRLDGEGGWAYNLQGVQRILYNLPQVISAQTVCVAEGEKDCDNLGELGFVATTNPLGAGKWREEYSETLRSKDVIVFGDVGDPDRKGEKHTAQVIQSLIGKAKSIKHIQLPNGVHDVSDYIESLAPDEAAQTIAKLIERTPLCEPNAQLSDESQSASDKPERIKLPPPPAPYVPPPLDLLPSAMQKFVRTGAIANDVDTAFLFLPLLSEIAACIGISRSIRIKEGWIQPAILWTSVVAASGEGKDPAMQAAIQPQLLHEFTFKRENDENIKEYKKRLAKWETTKKSERGERPDPPPLKTCLMDDATLEAVACRVNDNPCGILLAKAELSHWFGSFDQYRDRTGADLARWLQLYDGILFAMDRVTGNRNYRIPNPRIPIAAGVQPDTLRRILTDEYFERGLPARFLWAMPERNQPRRFSKIIIPAELFAKVSRLLSRLRELKPHEDEETELLMPVLLPLSPEAERIFEDFYNEVGRIIDQSAPQMRAQWSKLIGGGARLALMGQLAQNPDAEEISGEIMQHACALARWFGNEDERIFSILAETPEQREMRLFVEFVRRRGGTTTIRDAMQNYWPLRNDRAKAEQQLNAAVKAGLAKWEPVPTTPNGGKPTRQIRLNRPSASTKPSDLRGKAGSSVDVDAGSITENKRPEL